MEQQNEVMGESTEAAAAMSDTLFNVQNTVMLPGLGRRVEVSKIRMKHNGFVLRLMAKVMAELGIGSSDDLSIDMEDKGQLLQLIAKFADDINQLCALLSELELAEVEELDDADGFLLVSRIFVVNRDFFIEKVAPLIGMAVKKGAGPSVIPAATAEGRMKRTRKS